ncbi:RNA polymerase factor sigma-54 [Microvirga puerhi]|uniref:RNA polymerase sigma-54 factor n=1 Tax=Microvirga puerhi TaxID=2876078 RepID=A0ABS7VPS7_9HYPH|nr:RNA polymerase factor sigma-54 [Microvirga puerhi]MBZ6077125.1 RNA polymerase factor sigma-54 [Microvirga puerhi]
MTSMQRLELRQGQTLTLTPQLLQSIKLLQLSHLELCAFVEAELERNPLLQQAEADSDELKSATTASGKAQAGSAAVMGRLFPAPPSRRREIAMAKGSGLSGGSLAADATDDVEATLVQGVSLAEHLEAQLDLATADPALRAIGHDIIRSLDDAGYLTEELDDVAQRLRCTIQEVEAALALVQNLDPAGIGARNLAECLSLQLNERGRLDEPMRILLSRLDLVAKRDFSALERLCAVDGDRIQAMVAEIRRLDPKPGLAFSAAAVDLLVPDVLVRPDSAGGFLVELNPETLPRILLDKSYYARVASATRSEADKSFLSDCLQTAHWLTRSLDQRATTILKVATAIVRHQEEFFRHGVSRLRPLTLHTVAEETGLHESTISRVTANKAFGTIRGTFSMKFCFGSGLAGEDGGEHSARSVQHRIRELIASEEPAQVLSDDAIAQKLKVDGIRIARRTVAKYREALRIPSSAERRAKGRHRRPF